ncbi:MAG: HvfC/BufC family peptide modification chaperone [Solirubrobacteraceae bacterium]
MTDSSLRDVQQDFASFVTTLDSVEASDVAHRTTLARFRFDREISVSERLHIYTSAYFARIQAALLDDYGALHAAIGDDAFHDLAKLYLMAHPPRRFSLRFAGERLPEFLRGPIAEAFTRRWPFAADLAELEWARVDVFDERDTVALEREALATVPPEDWAQLRFALVPAHRILSLAWPVQRTREAWAAGTDLPTLSQSATTLLCHRHRERVHERALSPVEARALDLVRSGQDFATVCDGVAELTSDADAATAVLGFLERWIAEELLAAQA